MPDAAPLFLAGLLATGCCSSRPSVGVIRPGQAASFGRQAERSSAELKLVTFNVWGLPGWLTRGRADRFARIGATVRSSGADVVLLQEVWTSRARTCLAPSHDWSVAVSTESRSLFRQSGLVTLTRHRILQTQFRSFSAEAWPDKFVNKGALKATLEVPGVGRVNVWNVHLQAGPAEHTRLRQVVELLRWVQEADDGQVADVVGGDFNCEPGSAAHALLRASWGMDVEEEQHGWHRITYDGLSRRPGRAQTVDYVFRAGRAGPRPQVRSSEIAMDSDRFDDRLSDHLGLEVSMVFRAAAGLDPDHERLAMARALVWPLPSE